MATMIAMFVIAAVVAVLAVLIVAFAPRVWGSRDEGDDGANSTARRRPTSATTAEVISKWRLVQFVKIFLQKMREAQASLISEC